MDIKTENRNTSYFCFYLSHKAIQSFQKNMLNLTSGLNCLNLFLLIVFIKIDNLVFVEAQTQENPQTCTF